MPDWAGLASQLASEGGLDATLSGPQVGQEYERRFGRVQLIEAVRRALHVDDARPGRSQVAFSQLPFDTVYTTNFDVLLEAAYSASGRPFRSLVGELQLPFHAGQTATSIVKMHGDLRHEEHIVLTQKDYERFLDAYPVIATHLSAMLITRTPLFIGYSLTDPDFLSIKEVVRSRLGQFERMSYVVQFDAQVSDVEAAFGRRIHIINLVSDGRTKDEMLQDLFLNTQRKLDTRAGARLRRSRPDIFEEVSPGTSEPAPDQETSAALLQSTSKLCFVMMPFTEPHDRIYRDLIVPAIEDTGLSAVRADEIPGTGFVMEQIRAAIQQARLCIAEVTDRNPNVLYEVGFAEAMRKPVILMASDLSQLPFDIASRRVLCYSTDLESSRQHLREAITHALTEDQFAEAERLIAAGSPRGAIAVTAVILEHLLRELANRRDIGLQPRLSARNTATLLERAGVIDKNMRVAVDEVTSIRNRAVHATGREPNQEEAQFVLDTARKISQIP
ncbi:MAG: SIR2 family protein [Terriglobia bacterium]|jgi:nucleoside 2-deoxyribosyltransferase